MISQDWHDSDPCSSSEGTLPCHLARRTGRHQALGIASASRHPSNSCNSWAIRRGCFNGPATKQHWRSFGDSQPCPPHGPAICPAGQAALTQLSCRSLCKRSMRSAIMGAWQKGDPLQRRILQAMGLHSNLRMWCWGTGSTVVGQPYLRCHSLVQPVFAKVVSQLVC